MKNRGIRLGRSVESGELIRYDGNGCITMIGPPRSGKGRDVLLPILLDLPISLICIDVKGELSAVTARKRRKFGKVIYLDPYRLAQRWIKGARSSRYNPMARLDARAIDFSAQAAKNAEGLVWQESGHDRFFTGGARGIATMLQMGLVAHAEPEDRTLTALRSVITGEYKGGVDVFGFAQMILDHSTDTALRQLAARFCVQGAREARSLGDVLQTADEETRFLSDAAIAECVSGSDFSFVDLRKEIITVFVILPLDYLDVNGKFFRLIIASALSELLQHTAGGRVLIMMDEFFQLGRLDAIRNAMSMASGMNVQLFPVLQDINQLIELYPQGWQTFLNAAVRVFLSPRDENTSEHLSSLAGSTERRSVSRSYGFREDIDPDRTPKYLRTRLDGSYGRVAQIGISTGTVSRPLLLPHEARELPSDEMLLFIENINGVVRATRRPYWQEREFKGEYDDNPYFS